MHVDELIDLLDDSQRMQWWLRSIGLSNVQRAATNLDSIARSGMTIDQLASLCGQLRDSLADSSDPDMAVNNLEKFVLAARSPLALGSLFQRDPTALPILLTIFSASQHLSDLLVRDAESYDYLRLAEGQLYAREILVQELVESVSHARESMQAMQILRRFKHRETLRIAFGDLIAGHRLEQVAQQISFVAEAVIQAALVYAIMTLEPKWGRPLNNDGSHGRFAVLALGKLGATELNYSSDIDLIAVYESDGRTSIGSRSNQAYFERLTRETVKLLSEPTSLGAAYRVDLRLRPQGSRGPICCNRNSFLRYYDLQGRTWERQALIKARPVAGDLDFGDELLQELTPWIYHRILNRFDIAGIKALKRQIEHHTLVAGEERTNVKTGYGGIRDIEFTTQFLQLLNGAAIKSIRTQNTLDAISLLAKADCLNRREAELLGQNYCWLRTLEHRLQIMFDLQTHTLPDDPHEMARMARRMGYREYFGRSVLDQFREDLQGVTEVNNRILHHLLHNAFAEDVDDGQPPAAIQLNAVDLVLQSDLSPKETGEILAAYRFRDPAAARDLVEKLGRESTIFLSSRRCRHFLAAISLSLLEKISQTPDPDATLVSLSNVVDAIGGKGALWELFSYNTPSLDLFVRLCSTTDYLCSIIKSNPGMIDELIDSLLMNQLPTRDWLRLNLEELTSGAADKQPILHSFKNVHHLRVGIRDIAGKDAIQDTHRALSDIAEVCIERIADEEFEKCVTKFTDPPVQLDRMASGNSLVILGLGKLGAREPNYHSDLDVIFLFDADQAASSWTSTSSQHFYSELAIRITRTVTQPGPRGRLYELDSRLRPTGRSGSLAVSLVEFERYFDSGEGQLWERLALCKSRPVYGQPALQSIVHELAQKAIVSRPWVPTMAAEIREMRFRMQENCQPQNLKRGVGGTVDIEFMIQMLQLRHAAQQPEILVPGTIAAIEVLTQTNLLKTEMGSYLKESYQFLRSVESHLRLLNTTARHDLPDGMELEKLAWLLRMSVQDLTEGVADYRQRNRERFERMFLDHASNGCD